MFQKLLKVFPVTSQVTFHSLTSAKEINTRRVVIFHVKTTFIINLEGGGGGGKWKWYSKNKATDKSKKKFKKSGRLSEAQKSFIFI